MTNQLAKPSIDFTFEDHEIRTVMRNGEPWFYALDVCQAIGIKNVSDSLYKLDQDEKDLCSAQTLGLTDSRAGSGAQNICIISESGLYTLILRCRDAVKQGTLPWRFRKWVTNEVLPSIRKTGRYQVEEQRQQVPVFRYVITLHYRDVVTGQEEALSGGANSPEEIVRGTAKKFGIFIPEMLKMPVNAYY